MEAAIEKLSEIPIPTILILAGIVLLVFSVLFEVQSDTGKNKPLKVVGRKNINYPGIILGLLLLGVGIFYPAITAPEAEEVPTPTAEPATAQVIPTLSVTEMLTFAPTEAFAASATPLPVLTLKDGCVFSTTWIAASTDNAAAQKGSPDSKGCLTLEAIGISADNAGVLHLFQTAKKNLIASGIYTSVTEKSVIEFKVHLNNLYIIYPENPAVINFAIAPAGDPLTSKNTARFKLFIDSTAKNPLVYFVLADLGETNGSKVTTQHYEYGRTYSIRLELTGVSVRVYINNVKMSDELSSPSGPKVFYLGYNLPTLGGADIEITDVTVDGVLK